jgi:ATP synthase protein I
VDKQDKRQLLDAFSIAASTGLSMVATVAVGLFLGRWLDAELGTAPWLTGIGIILGMFAGLWGVYKRLLHK